MKYRVYFSVKFQDGLQEDNLVKSIKQGMKMLKEIDTKKSKCFASVTIIKGE